MKAFVECILLQPRRNLRTFLSVMIVAIGSLFLAVSGGADDMAPLNSANPEIWRFYSEAWIYRVAPTDDGGALVATSWIEPDGSRKPNSNTIFRLDHRGSPLWRYSGPEGWRVVLQDATPDGRLILLALTPNLDNSSQPSTMKLAVLDGDGKMVRETDVISDSNWAWLSTNGELLLRWDSNINSLLLEKLLTGRKIWSFESVQPPARLTKVDFVQPIWGSGLVLIGDAERGVVESVDISGRHVWRIKGLKWYPPAASPILASMSGRWLAAILAHSDCQIMPDIEDIDYRQPHETLKSVSDTLTLIRVTMSEHSPEKQDRVDIVWRRTMETATIESLVRKSLRGGSMLYVDLFEQLSQEKYMPSLTILTRTALSTLRFDTSGILQDELAWTVPDIDRVCCAWLLPGMDRILLRLSKTKTDNEKIRIADRNGAVLWESEPMGNIAGLDLDAERRKMLVRMYSEVRCYQLKYR